jgi:hypothetical protein
MKDQSGEAGRSYAADTPLSSILNFIKENLRGRPGTISMQFNPWRYQTEEILLVGFFNSLAKTLKAKLTQDSERAAKEIADLFKAIPQVGNVLSEISKKYGDLSLEELKRRIEDILLKKHTRVVVLMDDIDRLSLEEIQATFRLIKLSGSLKYVTYILAFDDKMVAAALKQRYISDEETGHGFLEKIVQVPLRLPKTPNEVLLRFCRERIKESADAVGVKLDTEQTSSLDEYFSLFSELLQTPRQCKRIDNALIFAFALLNGEVNPVDLIAIETLRALVPKLYEVIRSNREYFLGGGTLSKDEFEKRLIEPALSGTPYQARQIVHEVLIKLFPAMGQARDRFAQIQRNLYDTFADHQRIASEYYFDRFFTYNVPLTEVRDSQIASILAGIETRDVRETANQLQEIINGFTSNGSDRLINKLSLRRKLLDIDVSKRLAPALCAIGQNFRAFGKWNHPSDAALLVRQLVLNIPPVPLGRSSVNSRTDTIHGIAEACPIEARAILFLDACLDAIGRKLEEQQSYLSVYGYAQYSEPEEARPLISAEQFDELRPLIAEKIKGVHKSGYLYAFNNREVSRQVVDFWVRCSSHQEVGALVENAISKDPNRAIAVVSWYIRDPNAVEIAKKELYEPIHKITNSSILLGALSKDFGNALSNELIPNDPRQEQLHIAKAYRRLVEAVEHENQAPDKG